MGSSDRNDLSRRRFITAVTSGAAAATLSAPGGAAGHDNKQEQSWDTIVVGGGFAGITAARDAAFRGLDTLLLEARPRLGGRTHTTDFAGHDLEVGGTWLGWSQPHIWSEVMRYGLTVDESAAATAGEIIWLDGRGQRVVGSPDQYAELFQKAADAFFAPAREMFPRPFEPLRVTDTRGLDQISAAAAIKRLNLPADQEGLALAFAAINGHSHPDKSSYLDQLRWIALGDFDLWNLWDNLGRYRIRGGTASLIRRMAADSNATLKTDCPVASISQSDSQVTITARSGESFRAKTAIVTAPLNCLVDIEFSPALSDAKTRVSRQRHTGSGTKLYVKTRGKRARFMAHGAHDKPLAFLWTEYDDPDSQLLCGFGASPDLLDVSDQDAVAAAVQQYVPDVALDSTFTYDWNADPWAKGTWCMYPPGVLTAHLADLQRPEGRVYFASGDIASGWRGFIDGAVESGAAAARQVADRLRSA